MKMTHKPIQTEVNTDKLCETKQNQHYSPIKKNKRDLGIHFEPFPLLEFSPPLERCSDIYTVTLLFYVLFIQYSPIFLIFEFSLSIIDLLYQLLTLNIITRHAPLLLIGCKCVLGHGLTLWSNAFFPKLLRAPLTLS